MDLKDFVATTLTQIASGVRAAHEDVRSLGGQVNPAINLQGSNLASIDFDVAVTAASDMQGKAGAKLEIASFFSADAGGGSSSRHEVVNRIRFSVPMRLPADEDSLDYQKKRREESDRAIGRGREGMY